MRRIVTITAPAVIIALWAGLAPWSCEEALEACPPCDAVSGGNLTGLSGDPRLDVTIWVADELVSRFEREWKAYERDLERLAEVFSLPSNSEQLATTQGVADLAEEIENELLTRDARVSFVYEPARCSAGSQKAAQAMLRCQERLDCYISDDCRDEIVSADIGGVCHGLCIGSCSGGCAGRCYGESKPEGDECDGICMGSCLGSTDACPGLCIGGCEGRDAQNDTEPCEGECAVGCLTRYGADCDGLCHGSCGRDSDGPCAGQCRGICDPLVDVCTGQCRGQFRPVGCDPTLCDERSLLECREVSRLAGWAGMTCQSAHVALKDRQSATSASIRARRALQIETLGDVLERMSKRQAFFALLVDARDIGKEVEAQQLSEISYLESLGYPAPLIYLFSEEAPRGGEEEPWDLAEVPPDKVFHPLFSLMARLSYLADRSLDDEDYLVPEGVAKCVKPALIRALEKLRSMAPVTSAAGEPVANRQASASVYTLIDTQQVLLDLVSSSDSPARGR